jgi:lysozyme
MRWLEDFWDWITGKSAPLAPPPVVAPTPPRAPVVPIPVNPLDLGPLRKAGGPLLAPKTSQAIKGMDISHYQPNVNWVNVVKEGFQFVFAKASDGNGTKALHFDTHRKNAETAGLPFGAYHFMRFGGLSAKQEAENFLKFSGPQRPGDLPWVVDVEWDGSKKYGSGHMDDAAANEAYELACRVRDLTKNRVIIYTSWPFFKGFQKPERFFEFLLWCPAYAKGISGPHVPAPWSRWAFWQYDNKHPAARAITGDPDLDANWFGGTRAQLDLLRKK